MTGIFLHYESPPRATIAFNGDLATVKLAGGLMRTGLAFQTNDRSFAPTYAKALKFEAAATVALNGDPVTATTQEVL